MGKSSGSDRKGMGQDGAGNYKGEIKNELIIVTVQVIEV